MIPLIAYTTLKVYGNSFEMDGRTEVNSNTFAHDAYRQRKPGGLYFSRVIVQFLQSPCEWAKTEGLK